MLAWKLTTALLATSVIPLTTLGHSIGKHGGHSGGQGDDFAQACYLQPLPSVPASQDNRTIPWGSPSVTDKNGKVTCCSSLDEVRQGIDDVDNQLLDLLSQRAAYVREATRFKATRDTVDVPTRDQQVIDEAVGNATQFHLPQVIAQGVFSAIINSSVGFELCVFDSFDSQEHGK
ncbi:hypothetical protein NP233_g30 [Leucocoprinus birnbaumii]|uniref:Chorismate mutase domain-containing protein n=1 Tax=Leucocoprinus birnbaumii TaxID=56174 RepID=A0AAD5Z0I7_9AGAR|nr:hypothetical protein NP233_g30 [Leucocoprinus birnbaumii]